jgi:hypothetical protein
LGTATPVQLGSRKAPMQARVQQGTVLTRKTAGSRAGAQREGLLNNRRVALAVLLGALVANAPLRIMQGWV